MKEIKIRQIVLKSIGMDKIIENSLTTFQNNSNLLKRYIQKINLLNV